MLTLEKPTSQDFYLAKRRYSTGSCGILALQLYKLFSPYGWKFCQIQGKGDHSVIVCPNYLWAIDVFGCEFLSKKEDFNKINKKDSEVKTFFYNPSLPSDYARILKHCYSYKEKLPNSLQEFSPDQQTIYWANKIFKQTKINFPELFI